MYVQRLFARHHLYTQQMRDCYASCSHANSLSHTTMLIITIVCSGPRDKEDCMYIATEYKQKHMHRHHDEMTGDETLICLRMLALSLLTPQAASAMCFIFIIKNYQWILLKYKGISIDRVGNYPTLNVSWGNCVDTWCLPHPLTTLHAATILLPWLSI